MKSTMWRICMKIIKTLNVLFMFMPVLYVWRNYYADITLENMKNSNSSDFVILIIFVLIYVLCGHIYDGFLISTVKVSEIIISQSLAVLLTDVVMYFVFSLAVQKALSVIPMLIVFIIQIIISVIWSYSSKKMYYSMFPAKRTAVIYECRQDVESLIKTYEMERKFQVVEIIDADSYIERGMNYLNNIEIVFLCGVHSHARNTILKYCFAKKIRTYVIPRIGDVLMAGASQTHLFHLPMLRVEGYNPSLQYQFLKRLMDITVAGIALVVFAPIMFMTAIAIKLNDGGTVFYKQCRLTKDGKEFNIIKFRSMHHDAEHDGVARLSTGDDDDRITSVGKIIRKTRVDELPQLLNILEGSMSLVGPRPERPEIAKQYEEKLPEFSLRLQTKAGLTGYAQVYGKYNTDPYDKLLMDLTYITNPGILVDLKIMLVTLKALFAKESTEGIMPGEITAIDSERNTREKKNEVQRCDTSV